MTFNLRGRGVADDRKLRGYEAEVQLTRSADERKLVILREEVSFADWWTYTRDHTGSVYRARNGSAKTGRGNGASRSSQIDPIFHKAPSRSGVLSKLDPDGSLLSQVLHPAIYSWQFQRFVAEEMGEPTTLSESGAEILLDKDGANIAEYLLQIKEKDSAAFRGIVETLQYILPSATDVATALTDELEKQVYLKVSEFGYEIPGWLVSSGTIRILAILGLLRHPQPQPLIVVEEIENGLDPRAAQLILEEIRSAVDSGKVQVILTTHSPYLLNLVPLDSVILVERISGKSVFSRPAGRQAVSNWAEKYAPGELYTMGVLSGTGSE